MNYEFKNREFNSNESNRRMFEANANSQENYYMKNLNKNQSSEFSNRGPSNNFSGRYKMEEPRPLKSEGNIESELEKEVVQILKSQKAKIQELLIELERRDKLIDTLTKREITSDDDKINAENFKRQALILEDKLKVMKDHEKSQMSAFSEKLAESQETENKARQQLIIKDKVIYDLDFKLKDKESQLNNCKKTLLDREATCSELKQDFNQINVQLKSLSSKLNQKEHEFALYRQESDMQFDKVLKENESLNEKLAQLVDVMKQQSKELREMETSISRYEQSNTSLNKQVSSSTDEIIKKGKEINRLDNEKNHYQSLLQEKTELLNFEKAQLDQIRQEYEKSSMRLYEYENSNSAFMKEKSEIVSYINNEIEATTQWIDTYLGVYFDLNYDIPQLPITFNKNLKTLINFDDLKFSVQNARKKLNEQLGKLNETEKLLKKEADEYLNEKEAFIQEKSSLKTELLVKQSEIIELNAMNENLQRSLASQDVLNKKLHNEINRPDQVPFDNISRQLTNIMNQINEAGLIVMDDKAPKSSSNSYLNFNYSTSNHEMQQVRGTNTYNLIMDNLSLLEKFVGTIKDKINNLQSKPKASTYSIENFQSKVDSLLEKEKQLIDKTSYLESALKSKTEETEEQSRLNNQLKEEIMLLQKDLEEVKKNEYLNQTSQKEIHDEKEKNKLNFFITKCNNLTNEIELKQMQISNQEEMISRRNDEIAQITRRLAKTSEELNSSKEVNRYNSQSFDVSNSKEYRILLSEKERLQKDNMSLMKLNIQLSSQLLK